MTQSWTSEKNAEIQHHSTPSIRFLNLFYRHMGRSGLLEPSPAAEVWEAGDTLDRWAAYRATIQLLTVKT